MKRIHIIGGGTFNYVRTHLALAAPAFGQLARDITNVACKHPLVGDDWKVHLHLTKMAYNGLESETEALLLYPSIVLETGPRPTTNDDVLNLVDSLCADDETAMIFLTAAICDFDGAIVEDPNIDGKLMQGTPSGKLEPRLESRHDHLMLLTEAEKILTRVRSKHAENPRKDIFLVTCKTTDGVSDEEMVKRGIASMKAASCNLVLVNDVKRRRNVIVTPEQAAYTFTDDRSEVVRDLVDMALHRAQGRFVRTKVESGVLIPLTAIPGGFAKVVQHCVDNGAYKDVAGNGKTVGHFAYNPEHGVLLSSRRHQNFNLDGGTDLVRVRFDEEGVVAEGAKPSAGARSQMQLFEDHPEFDCVVHFHCPLKEGVNWVPRRPQRNFECGSIDCGLNTSNGIQTARIGNRYEVGVVMLDQHGPNILFRAGDDPDEIIKFIDETFDLSRHTGEP
jgi:hypothetical protein